MVRSSRTRVATMSLVVLLAGLAACGHFGVELLPAGEDGVDAGGPGDAEIDGSVTADASVDAPLDARDAGCEGPDCPGTYVSAAVGDDTNPGTGEKPVKTIGRAMAIAKALGGSQDVFIAGGSGQKYDEKIALVEGVSLRGGFDCSSLPCGWSRDVTKYSPVIADTDYEGLVADKTITRKTVVEGVTIAGKAGPAPAFPGSAAMSILGGSPTVRACKVQGGDASSTVQAAKRSIGIAILGIPLDTKGALIEGSVVRAGASNDESIGIYIDRLATAPAGTSVGVEIRRNVIRGAQAASSAGIVAWSGSASLVIEDNRIDAGDATGTGVGAWGIMIEGTGLITRNRINLEGAGPQCPPSQSFCGGIHSFSSTAIITSNVIRGAKSDRSAAIMLAEAEGPAGIVIVNGNTLDGGGDGGDAGAVSAAIATRNSSGTNAVVGKVRNNILLYGTNAARFGVYEVEAPNKQAHLASLDHNDFWSESASVDMKSYHYWDGTQATDYSTAQIFSSDVPSLTSPGNISADPELDNARVHISQTSPCVNAGTPTEAPPHDIDGDGRPKGVAIDIGADETK